MYVYSVLNWQSVIIAVSYEFLLEFCKLNHVNSKSNVYYYYCFRLINYRMRARHFGTSSYDIYIYYTTGIFLFPLVISRYPKTSM